MGRASDSRASTAMMFGILATVSYTYLGYPLIMLAAARRRSRVRPPVLEQGVNCRSLSVIIPAYDEEQFLNEKLLDTLKNTSYSLDCEVIVVDDGSRDKTADIARAFASDHVRLIQQPTRRGKCAALNAGVASARGDIVVFTDANGSLLPGSLEAMASGFDDPDVAVVSGRKLPVGHGAHGRGESLYWKYETVLREAEGALGVMVGVDGGIFAVRRSAFRPLPPDVVADDYWIPLEALARGLKVTHASGAGAVESVSATVAGDFERRTRIAAGIWQGSIHFWRLADPRMGWASLAFLSHRVMRSMLVPWLLPALVVLSRRSAREHAGARLLYRGQIAWWCSGAVGAVSDAAVCAVPLQFGLLNVAAVRGGLRQLRGRQTALWRRTKRGSWL